MRMVLTPCYYSSMLEHTTRITFLSAHHSSLITHHSSLITSHLSLMLGFLGLEFAPVLVAVHNAFVLVLLPKFLDLRAVVQVQLAVDNFPGFGVAVRRIAFRDRIRTV